MSLAQQSELAEANRNMRKASRTLWKYRFWEISDLCQKLLKNLIFKACVGLSVET